MSKTLAPSIVTSRDPKGLKFISIPAAAYDKAKLSEEEAQRVNDTPGLAELIGNFIAENRQSNKYKDEEKKSNYGYRSGYRKPVEISDMIDILRSHWGNINPDPAIRFMKEVYPTLQFQDWSEGPFVIIRPGFFSDKYSEEVEEIFKALAKDLKGKFWNCYESQLGPQYLRQSERTLEKLGILVQKQPGSDLIVVSGQFGIHHAGRSVRRVREIYIAPEFGPGGKDGGTMLLTNPIRLKSYGDLWIDLPGDEVSPGAVGAFGSAPYFRFNDDGVKFSSVKVDSADDYCGSASLLLPQ